MITEAQLDQVMGSTVYDRDGDKIGQVGQVYLDDDSGQPSWMTVNTGLFGTSESFVPLAQAELEERGVRVPYEKAHVKGAPHAADDGHLDEAQQDELYRHYGLVQRGTPQPDRHRGPAGDQLEGRVDRTLDGAVEGAASGTAAGAVAGAAAAAATGRQDGPLEPRTVEPRPVETRTIDPRDGDVREVDLREGASARAEPADAETRGRHASDGPVDGGALPAAAAAAGQPGAGRMRLRRYVVTEQRTITVPVTREELRLEHADDAPSGGTLVDEVELGQIAPVADGPLRTDQR
jgi:sporulation protein YlmC with PRC-barrel domain